MKCEGSKGIPVAYLLVPLAATQAHIESWKSARKRQDLCGTNGDITEIRVWKKKGDTGKREARRGRKGKERDSERRGLLQFDDDDERDFLEGKKGTRRSTHTLTHTCSFACKVGVMEKSYNSKNAAENTHWELLFRPQMLLTMLLLPEMLLVFLANGSGSFFQASFGA